MVKKYNKETCPIHVMTDDEYNAMKIKEDKISFLSSLEKASSNQSFSSRKVKENVEKRKKRDNTYGGITSHKSDDLGSVVLEIPERLELSPIDEEKWDKMMEAFDELSPIDDITDEERGYYRRSSGGDKYDEMFKKERSMLSDVLTDIQKRSKIINSRINSMGGKGSYGVSKNFVDLVEAGTAMDNAKLQVIKAMADLKKTATDLRFKDQKNNTDVNEEDKDTIADRFYKSIIGGGSQKFIQSSMENYGSVMQNDNAVGAQKYNLTRPLSEQIPNYEQPSYTPDDVDRYGYIRNENKHVDICIYRYDDGGMEFVALDEHGDVCSDYELPDSMLLDTIEIKPMSKFAYDKYQRKYRIIDIDGTVGLDDLDDNRYDDITSDDKYDY